MTLDVPGDGIPIALARTRAGGPRALTIKGGAMAFAISIGTCSPDGSATARPDREQRP
jgi:hypothetical protein